MKDGVLTTPAHQTSKNTVDPSVHRKLDGVTQVIRERGPSSMGMHITPVLGQSEFQISLWAMQQQGALRCRKKILLLRTK